MGCQGQAAMSGACLVAAAGSQAGAWTGVAGVSAFGLQAAAEAGVVLERVIAVRDTAEFSDDTWGQVLGALIDGFDIVLFGGAARVRPGTARRVQTRLQHRGAVLVLVGTAGAFSCDLVIDTRAVWEGLAVGHGRLRSRRVEVSVEGRRVPRARHDTIWFPDADGHVGRSMAEPVAVPAPDPTAVPGHVPVVVPLRRTG